MDKDVQSIIDKSKEVMNILKSFENKKKQQNIQLMIQSCQKKNVPLLMILLLKLKIKLQFNNLKNFIKNY